MPNKLSVNETRFWLNEVRACIKRRDKELVKRNHYPYLIKYYEGDMYPTEESYNNRNKKRLAMINEYFPSTNSLLTEVMYRNPTVVLDATKPQAEEGTAIMKGALKYFMDRTDSLAENKLGLFDMVYAGFCGIEVGYCRKKDQEKEAGEREGVVSKVRSIFNKDNTTDKEIEEQLAKATPDQYKNYAEYHNTYVRRWNPMNIILDHRAERVKDMRYVGKIIRMTHAEFSAKYPDYKDKVSAGADIDYPTHENDADNKMVTLYELQVKKANNRYVNILIAPNYNGGEIDIWERPYTTNGFNLKIGTLDEYGKLYPVSRAAINKSIQDDINNYATFWMQVAERNIPKRGYTKGAIDTEGLRALNSKNINESVPVKGGMDSVWTIANTNVSQENKELYAIFQQQKEKLWAVSQSRIQGDTDARFATELNIQEAGYLAQQMGLQEGLRQLYRQELDTMKDIIVTYIDDEIFFKITGGAKPEYYVPQVVQNPINGQPMVANPLSEILTADYQVDVDMASAVKPNPDKIRKDMIEYLTWLMDPQRMMWLANIYNRTINIEAIEKSAKEFGFNPDMLFTELPPKPPEEPNDIEVKEVAEVKEEVKTEDSIDGPKTIVTTTKTQKQYDVFPN